MSRMDAKGTMQVNIHLQGKWQPRGSVVPGKLTNRRTTKHETSVRNTYCDKELTDGVTVNNVATGICSRRQGDGMSFNMWSLLTDGSKTVLCVTLVKSEVECLRLTLWLSGLYTDSGDPSKVIKRDHDTSDRRTCPNKQDRCYSERFVL